MDGVMGGGRKGGGMLGLKLGMLLFTGRDNAIGSMLLLLLLCDDVATHDGGIWHSMDGDGKEMVRMAGG